jgi:hypothetical protein
MRHLAIGLMAAVMLLAGTAEAAPARGLVCAIVDVFDCSAGECSEVDAETVGVPDLVRLDGSKKLMTALDPEFAGRSAVLDSMTEEGSKTVARAHEGDRSLVVAVEGKSGDAMLTVSDGKLVLVGYGECSEP